MNALALQPLAFDRNDIIRFAIIIEKGTPSFIEDILRKSVEHIEETFLTPEIKIIHCHKDKVLNCIKYLKNEYTNIGLVINKPNDPDLLLKAADDLNIKLFTIILNSLTDTGVNHIGLDIFKSAKSCAWYIANKISPNSNIAISTNNASLTNKIEYENGVKQYFSSMKSDVNIYDVEINLKDKFPVKTLNQLKIQYVIILTSNDKIKKKILSDANKNGIKVIVSNLTDSEYHTSNVQENLIDYSTVYRHTSMSDALVNNIINIKNKNRLSLGVTHSIICNENC